jgi:hypothetical protein
MYGKIFPEIFESTLMAEGGRDAVYVFMCMIALKDKFGIVPTDKRILARKIDMDIESLNKALDVLLAPDETSNLPDHDGKRIIALSELDDHKGNRGYWVVNHDHYTNKASKEDRIEQNKKHQQNYRDSKKNSKQPSASVSDSKQASASVSKRNQESAASAYIDIDVDVDIKDLSKSDDLDFNEFWELYPRKEKKKLTEKRWIKLPKIKRDKAIQDVRLRFEDTPKEFVPIPTTYLNDERWDDESINQGGVTSMWGAGE